METVLDTVYWFRTNNSLPGMMDNVEANSIGEGVAWWEKTAAARRSFRLAKAMMIMLMETVLATVYWFRTKNSLPGMMDNVERNSIGEGVAWWEKTE